VALVLLLILLVRLAMAAGIDYAYRIDIDSILSCSFIKPLDTFKRGYDNGGRNGKAHPDFTFRFEDWN
jgi:hypothetical protein